jgi:hypothetical protein
MWSTPSSRKAQVVARSAVAAGMGTEERDMVGGDSQKTRETRRLLDG